MVKGLPPRRILEMLRPLLEQLWFFWTIARIKSKPESQFRIQPGKTIDGHIVRTAARKVPLAGSIQFRQIMDLQDQINTQDLRAARVAFADRKGSGGLSINMV
jgi:hypothetical protein